MKNFPSGKMLLSRNFFLLERLLANYSEVGEKWQTPCLLGSVKHAENIRFEKSDRHRLLGPVKQAENIRFEKCDIHCLPGPVKYMEFGLRKRMKNYICLKFFWLVIFCHSGSTESCL
jgi:hypothetical protein